jgi:hypothetical protein
MTATDGDGMIGGGSWRRPLAFLLSVSNTSCLGLHFAYLTKVKTHCPSSERVRLRLAAILLERGS